MSDLISIQSGNTAPWLPAPETELVEVFDRHNIPLSGHVRQRGVDYVFWCAYGRTEPQSTWAYAWVSPAEISSLDRTDDFDAAFAAITAGKPLVVALYDEDDGIIGAITLQHPASYDTLAAAVLAELRSIERAFQPDPLAAAG